VPADYPRTIDSALKCIIYFLLLNTLLPISLMVTLEIIKVVEAQWIRWDAKLFDSIRGNPAKVSNSGLIEELGQLHYLFSDKTGTLTKNEMTSKAVTIGQV
jgi:phospholipid-translocating ATPase